MRRIFFALLFLISSLGISSLSIADGEQVITIEPGSSVIVEPAVRTKVICEGVNGMLVHQYCSCEYRSNSYSSSTMVLLNVLVFSNRKIVHEALQWFPSETSADARQQALERCEQRLAVHQACRR